MNKQNPSFNNQNKQKFKIIPNSENSKIKNPNSNPKIQKPKSSRQPFQINFSQKKLPQQRINSNIKIHQSNNIPQNKPIKYSKPFNSKNFNFKHEYSIYGRNNLDNSVIYDLHNAYWDVTKANRPTAKLRNIKTEDPFAVGNKHKTNFGYVYSAGGIPCRIEHGNVNMKLNWSIPPENLDYDPTLIICFEGLLEVKHPYNFLAKQCVREMLFAKGASEKILQILPKLIDPLKVALNCNREEIFLEAMNIAEQLSELVKENLNQYLHLFLQSINRRSFNLKYKERVFDLLRVFEINGGNDALIEIKSKIPTYMSSL